MNVIDERIGLLQDILKEKNIDVYLIPTSDYHESEYVGEYFKCREYMSGFTGSAGTLLVTKEEANLWVDGRYFIQGEQQVSGTKIKLMKMGEEGVPTLHEYLDKTLRENSVLAFDGKVMNYNLIQTLKEKIKDREIIYAYEEDFVHRIWDNRPSMSKKPAFLLEEKYTGESVENKINKLRSCMKEKGVDAHMISSLDDIAWLLNIRGNDVESSPVVLSYLRIDEHNLYLYVHKEVLNDELIHSLSKNGVILLPYLKLYEDVKELAYRRVLLDKKKVNYSIVNGLPTSIEILDEVNPTTLWKAIKNPCELDNIRFAHIKDGVAFTKFMYWLKNQVGKIEISEISASDYLENCRKEQENFIEKSFTTIAGYKEHAAMMHYSATKETDYKLEKEGLFLVDSGGQYFEGTTDITRTLVLGELTNDIKMQFTTVVKCNLNLANARFLYGATGANLDILARGPLWDMDLDYKCGTGHGIGFVLNVHEGPNNFSWKITPNRGTTCIFEEGMVTTNEPGLYIEGSHGIRIENELICRKGSKNEYGQFMYFENCTYAPIDLDGIDINYLNPKEIELLNTYHQMVYEKIGSYLSEEEREWLKLYTRKI